MPDASQYTQIRRLQANLDSNIGISKSKLRAPGFYTSYYAGYSIPNFPINTLISNKFTQPPPPPADNTIHLSDIATESQTGTWTLNGTTDILFGKTLTINDGITLLFSTYTLSNYGTIVINGTINASLYDTSALNNFNKVTNNAHIILGGSKFTNKSGSNLLNNGTIDFDNNFDNYGQIDNYSAINLTNSDANLTNYSGATINNNSLGVITNHGTINHNIGATINNYLGATINNTTGATFNNNGTYNGDGTCTNCGL